MTKLSRQIFAPDGVVERPGKANPPKNPEAQLQKQIIAALRKVVPKLIHFHPANEVRRGGKEGMINRAMNNAQGVVRGMPDIIILCHDGKTLSLEVKTATGRTSDAQDYLHAKMRGLGHPVHVVRSVEQVTELLDIYELVGIK